MNCVSRSSRLISLVLASLLSGCGVASRGTLPALPTASQGRVRGGQQPVSGASVQLYAVGTTGDGSLATPLLSPAVTTGSKGGFTFEGLYRCPSPDSLVYLVATGGNPGLTPSVDNQAIALMAALGSCGSVAQQSFIDVNEVTTVAAVYELSPFISGIKAIGSGSADANGLANAFAIATELADTASGTSPGTGVPAGTSVPVAQINTLADILSACINSSGGTAGDTSLCGELFTLTTPFGGSPPGDTVTATLGLAQNSAMSIQSLCQLASADPPFMPVDVREPFDWGVRLGYPSGFTVTPGSLSFGGVTTGFTATQMLTLTNNSAAGVEVGEPSLRGESAGDYALPLSFAEYGSLNDIYLDPGASVSIPVTFTPTQTGDRDAYVIVQNSSANPVLGILLSGSGATPTAGPVTLASSNLTFTQYGVASDVFLTNHGGTSLNISGVSFSGGNGFTQTNDCGDALTAGVSCTISVVALPDTNAFSSQITGTMTIVDDAAAGGQSVNLTYNFSAGGPTATDFGGWALGAQGLVAIPLGQYGDSGTWTLSLSGAGSSGFSFSGNAAEGFVQCSYQRSGSMCSVPIYFNPSANGPQSAMVTLSLNEQTGSVTTFAGTVGQFLVTGTGDPAGADFHFGTVTTGSPSLGYSASPPVYTFGELNVGQSARSDAANNGGGITLVNSGTLPLTFSAPVLSGTAAGEFSASANCAGIAPGSTCSVVASATPAHNGLRQANLAMTVGGVTQSLLLNAFGTPPPPVVTGPTLTPAQSPNPASLSFSTANGTTSAAQSVTVNAFQGHGIVAKVETQNLQPDTAGVFLLSPAASCDATPCALGVSFAPPGGNPGTPYTYYLYLKDAVTGGQILIVLKGVVSS